MCISIRFQNECDDRIFDKVESKSTNFKKGTKRRRIKTATTKCETNSLNWLRTTSSWCVHRMLTSFFYFQSEHVLHMFRYIRKLKTIKYFSRFCMYVRRLKPVLPTTTTSLRIDGSFFCSSFRFISTSAETKSNPVIYAAELVYVQNFWFIYCVACACFVSFLLLPPRFHFHSLFSLSFTCPIKIYTVDFNKQRFYI